MTVIDGRTWLEHLSQTECWQQLGAAVVGRVGRTDAGSKLHGLDRSPSCCFEAGGIDADAESGWSVLVKGRASEIVNSEELRAVAALGLELWSLGRKEHWIRIRAIEVTGRRIHRPSAAAEEGRCA